LFVGGNANNDANAGLVYSNANNALSNTNANISSHLSFKGKNIAVKCKPIQTLPLGKK
jgi:hypothetical protein